MFLLNLQSKTPIHRQIREQIIRFIHAGVLKQGDRLPSVRSLAVENGINPNTVARAYSELEAEGYVYNLPKKGVYVAERNREKEPDPVRDVIVHLKDEGVSKSELLRVIEEVFKEDSHA